MNPDEDKLLFFDAIFLQHSPLTNETALNYFAISPFYDKLCNNEVLKMQSKFADIDVKEHLERLEGIYYTLDEENNNNTLFIVNKYENAEGNKKLLKIYYIMHGYIYAAPTIDAISDAKLLEILWQISCALDLYEEKKKFDFLKGPVFEDGKEDKDGKAVDSALIMESIQEFLS